MIENQNFVSAPAEPIETPAQSQKYFSKIGLAYVGGAVVIFVVQYLVSWILMRYLPDILSDMNVLLILSSLSMYLLAMPFLVIFVRRIPGKRLTRHKMSVGKWFVAFLMSYAIMYISNFIGIFMTQIIGIIKGDPVHNPLEEIVTKISPWTALALMVVCAPIVEEYIFRKLLIDRTVKYGEKTAIVLSGLMFGLFHGNLNQFVYAFSLGMFFGFIYAKTGKLIYTITLHAAINFMGSIPGILMMKSDAFTALENMSGETEEFMQIFVNHASDIMIYLVYLVLILILVVVGVVCWALSFKKMKCAPGEVVIPKGQWFRTVILNVGMILYILYWSWEIIRQLMV